MSYYGIFALGIVIGAGIQGLLLTSVVILLEKAKGKEVLKGKGGGNEKM